MASSKILLILGAGSNVGHGVARAFKKAGYRVVLVSRRALDGHITPDGFFNIKADLADFASVPTIFATVKAKFGEYPNVVVYNAAAMSPPSDPANPFTLPVQDLERDMAINNTSAYVAAREAVFGFEKLPEELSKVFIYTGNQLPAVVMPVPSVVGLGIGKSAASYWIGTASTIFKENGYK